MSAVNACGCEPSTMRSDSPVIGAGGSADATPAASVSALTVPTAIEHVARCRRLFLDMDPLRRCLPNRPSLRTSQVQSEDPRDWVALTVRDEAGWTSKSRANGAADDCRGTVNVYSRLS